MKTKTLLAMALGAAIGLWSNPVTVLAQEHKDHKDLKDHKEFLKEIKENHKELIDVVVKDLDIGPGPGPGPVDPLPPNELSQLIDRVSGLEKAIDELKKK